MSEPIQIEYEGQIATVILNRPQQRNAINRAMWLQLRDIANRLDRDAAIRVVIFRGAGETAFSGGADISEFESVRNSAAAAQEYARDMDSAMDAIAIIGKPTISLIRGFCVGGGLELATATDLRIAAAEAKFGVPIGRLGILVGYKEMRRLVALVGPGPSMNLLLTARLIDSAEALRLGLVSEVVSTTDIEQHTYDLAKKMCGLAPLSARWHKQILQTVLTNPGLSQLSAQEEARPFACFDTADFQEGRRAFLEKRRPKFEGK